MVAGSPVMQCSVLQRCRSPYAERSNSEAGIGHLLCVHLSQLALEKVHQIPNVVQISHLRRGELYAKRFLDGEHEADVAKAVPLADVTGRHLAAGFQFGIVENIAKDRGQLGKYFVGGHDGILTIWLCREIQISVPVIAWCEKSESNFPRTRKRSRSYCNLFHAIGLPPLPRPMVFRIHIVMRLQEVMV